jgi:miniconductance mechanosensitive channel
MFVFKDTILGLVAGIQISANDILRVGDYIEMPNRHADGTIIDISLNTVKVHNANRTITTIPTYAFVTESFWNWRGLDIKEGRRIKRFININMHSIKYCDDKMLKLLKKNEFLKSFFENEISSTPVSGKSNTNEKKYTNATLFRFYTEAYLKSNPYINTGNTFMVHHLQPTENGLPMEIYVYVNEKNVETFEKIQADIFDHLIAVMPQFGLKVFQKFSGYIEEKL